MLVKKGGTWLESGRGRMKRWRRRNYWRRRRIGRRRLIQEGSGRLVRVVLVLVLVRGEQV